MLDYSFNSQDNTKNLQKLQQSIINQYKRLKFGQQSIIYSISNLDYTCLPSKYPQNLKNNYKCLRLSNCPFYQMLTYSIFQFLLNKRSHEKNQVLNKIKRIILNKNFMKDTPTIKGLLLKGLKMMYDRSGQQNNFTPVAHCLWKNDCMSAFGQFWKIFLANVSAKKIIEAETIPQLQTSIFQLICDKLCLNFTIYYQKDSQFEIQTYSNKSSSLTLNLVIYLNFQKQNNSKYFDMSDSYQNDNINWNYLILVDYYHSGLLKQQISFIQQKLDQSNLPYEEKQQLMKLFKDKEKTIDNFDMTLRKKDRIIQNQIKKLTVKKEIQTNKLFYINENQDINSIKFTMQKADELLNQMKIFCQKLGKNN